jgi:hypothetical protein
MSPEAVWVCRAVLICLFGASVIGKVPSIADFSEVMQQYVPVSASAARSISVVVIVAEVSVVGLLAVPAAAAVVTGFGVALGLLVIYTAAIVRLRRRGASAPCHCFGASTEVVSPYEVARNALMGSVAVAGIVLIALGAPLSVTAEDAMLGFVGAALIVALCINARPIWRVMTRGI